MKHLTNPELQSYAEGTPGDAPEMEDHLRVCAFCRQQLAAYRMIFSALRSEREMAFSPDFARSVLNRIEAAREKKIDFIESGLSAAAVVVGMALTLYYVNWRPVSEFLVESYRNSVEYIGEISFLPHIPAHWIGANTSLLFLGALALILVGWLDSVLSRHKMSLK